MPTTNDTNDHMETGAAKKGRKIQRHQHANTTE